MDIMDGNMDKNTHILYNGIGVIPTTSNWMYQPSGWSPTSHSL